ncbi:hypothetical protein WA158_004300 [Blastocystis sp. Blastoise]
MTRNQGKFNTLAQNDGIDRLTNNKNHFLLDKVICKVRSPFFSFFPQGWGDLDLVYSLKKQLIALGQETEKGILPPQIKMHLSTPEILVSKECVIQDGSFDTPCRYADHLPRESLTAYIRIVTPIEWGKRKPESIPTILLLPGTGEVGFKRRMSVVAQPMARLGYRTIMLEGPYYGLRRPKDQYGCHLRHVSDLPLLGCATIEEARSLVRWIKETTKGPVAVAGMSMGGLHSSMTASTSPYPLGVISLLGPPSAVPVFTTGVMSSLIPWEKLQIDAKYIDIENRIKESSYGPIPDDIDSTQQLMTKFLSVTDVENFPCPMCPDGVLFIVAKNDAYIPFQLIESRMKYICEKWEGAHIRWVNGGHASTYLFQMNEFTNSIQEIMGIMKKKEDEESIDNAEF